MQVLSMLFREMKEYDDQKIRSYSGNASPANLLDLERLTDHGRDFSASALAGIAGRVIRPVADDVHTAAISGGFAQQRMMFTMSCLVRGHSRQQIIHEISGYTDHVGAHNSLKGVVLDENMCLYFNSVTRLSRADTDTSRGRRMLTQIQRSNQVISRQTNPDFTMARGTQGTLTMRPEDLFTRNTTNSLFERRARQEGSMDLRGGYTMSTMKFSNRLNTSSTRFMSRAMQALSAADRGDGIIDEYQHERDTTKIFKDARSQVKEDAIAVDPIFEEMTQDTQLLEDGFIRYGELMTMDPNFDWDGIPVYFTGKGERKTIRGDYRPWDGMENVDVAATMLVNSLPMYMINHQLASISFTATNRDTMGEMVVVADNAFPIAEGPDLREVVPIFCQRLETEILLDMLPWPDCELDLKVETSIAGETYVRISLDGENEEEYAFPTFCDSVVSPIVTESSETMDNMASTIFQISDNIGSSLNYDNDKDDRKRIITDVRSNPISAAKRRSY